MSQEGVIDIIGTHPEIPTEFVADVGSAIPIANVLEILGTYVVAGTSPVETTASGNTVTIEVQISQALAASDVTKIGLANFDSSAFSVDANGFVTLNGGGSAATEFNVDAFTAPGTDPVVPDGLGQIIITGAQVATGVVGTNVIRSNSLAANSVTIEIQRSTDVAATDATKNGVSHFDSSIFSVDSNGFVSVNGTGVGETITGDTGGALSPVLGNWDVLGDTIAAGTTPVITNGTGNTLTINVQRSQALAAADASKIGLCNFDSSSFSVDSDGFVALTTPAGGFTWTDVTGATQALSVSNGYFTNRGAGVTYTLPATAALGDCIKIDGKLGITTIAQNANQSIRFSSLTSTVGVGGTLVGTNLGDCITLRCSTAGASTVWVVENSMGNWNVN